MSPINEALFHLSIFFGYKTERVVTIVWRLEDNISAIGGNMQLHWVIVLYRLEDGSFGYRTATVDEVDNWESTEVEIWGKLRNVYIVPEDFNEYTNRMGFNELFKRSPNFAQQ